MNLFIYQQGTQTGLTQTKHSPHVYAPAAACIVITTSVTYTTLHKCLLYDQQTDEYRSLLCITLLLIL